MTNRPSKTRKTAEMTGTYQATIAIDGHKIAVEMLDNSKPIGNRRIVQGSPVAVADWPITPTEIEAAVMVVYRQYNCQPSRPDIAWAIGKAGSEFCSARDSEGASDYPYCFYAVWTPAEARRARQVARDEAEDSLV